MGVARLSAQNRSPGVPMHIVAHTYLDAGPIKDYPALLFDWDRHGALETTTGPISAVLALPGPTLRFVTLDHVSHRRSGCYWRRLTESTPATQEEGPTLRDHGQDRT